MKKKSGHARKWLVLICILLGIVLTLMIAATIYANYLLNLVNRAEETPQQTLSQAQIEQIIQEETVAPEATNGPVVQEEEIDWGEDDFMISTPSEVINILLIGQDARPGEGRARSDSMILVTFNKNNNTITMTSFLRDLYVKIPGYSDNKMNAAYAFGGMELLNRTLEENFGVYVDGNVEVNFTRFAEVIDLLGGIDINLREDEAQYINRDTGRNELSGGMMHLDGEQALSYSRIRYLDADADLSRTNRQRKVLNVLLEKFRNTKLTTLLGLLDDLLPMLTTDMSHGEILAYATELFPMLADCTVVSQRVPADGAFQFATIRQMSCVVADMDAARELLRQTMGE